MKSTDTLRQFPRLRFIWVITTLLIFVTGGSLTSAFSPITPRADSNQLFQVPTPLPESEITFQAEIPPNSPTGESITLSILDEVTGLALNPRRISMQQADPFHYTLTTRIPLGSVIKYQFVRQGSVINKEFSADGKPIRYRLYYVDGPGVVEDIVSRWADTPLAFSTGRIIGEALDLETGVPIPNLMVVAGGIRALTASDGSFLIDGLPPGKHHMVGYSLDGSFRPFKHDVIVAPEAATPVTLQMRRAPIVNVTFNVTVPADTVPTVPILIAGNLLQLGNTYADLDNISSTLATRMPQLVPLSEGQYSVTLPLAAGTDVRYKYTMGNGLWNAEHSLDGNYRVRQIVIPEGVEVHSVEDRIETWQAGKSDPIWFDVTIPAYTPEKDKVFIQFNLFSWMQPVPMWSAGNNRWGFRLSGPLNIEESVAYRYCRNAQCGINEGIATDNSETLRQFLPVNPETQDIRDSFSTWKWLLPRTSSTTVLANAIQPRGPEFIGGVEFQTNYHPSWDAFMADTFSDVRQINANWVTITPTWSLTNNDPPNLTQVPGQDILWPDLVQTIQGAQSQGLRVGLYPQLNFPVAPEAWWQSMPRTGVWWQVWFERYRTFAIHHADMAQRQGSEALILGGDWVTPALPGGVLADGTSSGVPGDAEARWENIIADVRAHYNGKIFWALPYPEGIKNPPAFISQIDEIYLLWNARLAEEAGTSEPELEKKVGELLDEVVLPFQLGVDIPLTLAAAYPSASGGITGCLPGPEGSCLPLTALAPPNPDIPDIELNLAEQVEVYNALLAAINERPWISGFVSRGYYPPIALEDKSTSIHGKPASDVLWFWFSDMLDN